MKTLDLLKLTMTCVFGMFVFTSCDFDEDDDRIEAPDAVEAAFLQMYGEKRCLVWDIEDGGYYVGEFRINGVEHEAWFRPDGTWLMTEIDHGRNLANLPEAVQNGYAATVYAQQNWLIDDIDEIQRPEREAIYIIEVEKKGQPDYDLYFDINGTLYKEIADGPGDRDHGLLDMRQ